MPSVAGSAVVKLSLVENFLQTDNAIIGCFLLATRRAISAIFVTQTARMVYAPSHGLAHLPGDEPASSFWPHDWYVDAGGCGPAYPKAICLALVDAALRSAIKIDRRAGRLSAVAPMLRTSGTEPINRHLLSEDAETASALATNLSRCAATRRRELSSLRIFDCEVVGMSATTQVRRNAEEIP